MKSVSPCSIRMSPAMTRCARAQQREQCGGEGSKGRRRGMFVRVLIERDNVQPASA